MNTHGNNRGFFEIPQATIYLLIAANIVMFALCFKQSGTGEISSAVLLRNGAMYPLAIGRHEYWRLVACGFLHANLLHLTTNMICLALWGGHLERRVGTTYFLIIYCCAIVVGAFIGTFTHSGPYLTVGASGGTSGILGALLYLWIRGKSELLANFFVINIGINVAVTMSSPRIDWGAHLVGFAAGMIACAMLDLVEKANHFALRCKFPEFVKINFFLAGCAIGLLCASSQKSYFTLGQDGLLSILACILACFLIIKLFDFALSLKHGLAIVAVTLSAANAGLIAFVAAANLPALISVCGSRRYSGIVQVEGFLAAACSNPSSTIGIVAVSLCVLTILLYSQELYRGIGDVGFVGASLRAERKRRAGI